MSGASSSFAHSEGAIFRYMIRIGTSGFSYKEWLGSFYPERLAGTKMLAHYAARLPTVEINYTFRAMPRRQMLERWAAETPAHFRFALKAPQRITHVARLRGAEDAVSYFVTIAQTLGERLGPALFQLPPDLGRDDVLLGDFLSILNRRMPAAFEFRNRSWFDDKVFQTLRDAGAALCIAETEKLATPIERTAPYVYFRLRRDDYDSRALGAWAGKFASMAEAGDDLYVYFKHEERAPALALELRAMLTGAL